MKQLFEAMHAALAGKNNVVLCTVIASSGSTPRGAGAKMLVFADGSSIGTVGGGVVEHLSIKLAIKAYETQQSYKECFHLHPNEAADIGMVCGGDVMVHVQFFDACDACNTTLAARINALLIDGNNAWLITAIYADASWSMGVYDEKDGLQLTDCIDTAALAPLLKSKAVLQEGTPAYFVEPLVQCGKVYVFGGGHVSQELVPVLAHIGFRPVVFDDRAKFADMALFPDAIQCILGDFLHIADSICITPQDYIVIMTRGHQADYDVLRYALGTKATYVGMIGSKSKMEFTRQRLLAAGVTPADIARIHNPIGTAIMAETPAEIAISIAGEMILHRAKNRE